MGVFIRGVRRPHGGDVEVEYAPGGPAGSSAAADISIVDAGEFYAGANVEAALQELGAPAEVPVAADISIVDAGGSFTGDDVETALQELGVRPRTIFDAYAYLRDEKASGSNGGSAASASWNTRVLNTEVFDSDGIVALASNQFTLQAGTYFVEASAPALFTGKSRLRIRNITDSSTVGLGPATYGDTGAITSSAYATVRSRIVIAGTKTFELQHYITNGAGFGVDLGTPTSTGEIEVYGEVMIWREP